MEELERLIFTDPVKLDLAAVLCLSGRLSESAKREILYDLSLMPGPVDNLRVVVEQKEPEVLSPLEMDPIARQIAEDEEDFGLEQGIIEGGDGTAADFGSLSTLALGTSYLVESDGMPDAINEEIMQEIPGAIAAAAIIARQKKIGERMKREMERNFEEAELDIEEDGELVGKGRHLKRSRVKLFGQEVQD